MKVSVNLFQLKVLVNNKPVQEYHKDNCTFIEGREGSNYSLSLTNLTSRRLLAHPTVDGLSAMTGKEADRNDSSHGYILNPYTTIDIPGWRLDDANVAKFFFAGAGKSYAEKKGSGENKGVIACAVWEEKPEVLTRAGISWHNDSCYKSYTTAGNSTECCTMNFGADSAKVTCTNVDQNKSNDVSIRSVIRACNLGTGFGKAASHAVVQTSFVPTSVEPVAVAVIYYDDVRGLKARGIRLSMETHNTSLPNPFPKTQVGCEPPKDWPGNCRS